METERFERAVHAFTAIDAGDPERVLCEGTPRPRALVEVERLLGWLRRLNPEPSEALLLAAHSQHVGRFRIPRTNFPEGRSGYLRWRAELAALHAQTAAEVLNAVGYAPELVAEVRAINLKQGLQRDADVQTMEDALCLAFLADEYAAFCDKYDDVTLLRVLRKTWRKMSPRAQAIALTLEFDGRPRALLEQALAPAAKSGET